MFSNRKITTSTKDCSDKVRRLRELLQKAEAVSIGAGAVMECGDIKIDLLGSRVLLKGKILELTTAEYDSSGRYSKFKH